MEQSQDLLTATQVEVYFDDFKVTQIKSPVVQTDDYYASGLSFNSYQRENNLTNNYLYNSKELQEDLQLGLYDYGARFYDPAIFRWISSDPLSEQYLSFSPYNFVLNDPISNTDPNGTEVYFVNGQDAAKVLADLNTIFRNTYGLDHDIFNTETRSVQVQKQVTESAEFDISNPDTWDGEVTKTVTVNEKRTYITTDSQSGFDFNKDKYSAATFDILNTKTQFKGEILPGNTPTGKWPIKTTLSDAKGFSDKKERSFTLSADLNQASSNNKNWSFGGTMLHETINHFHPLGNTEDNTGLQSHFGLPFSRLSHPGGVQTQWSPKELIRLNKERAKGK